MEPISNAQIDKLGRRLRLENPTLPEDVGMYVDWSATFEEPLLEVEQRVLAAAQRAEVDLIERTGRIKQLYSVIAKLRRPSAPKKLSSLDDVAGLRAVMRSERDVNALVLQLAPEQVKRVRDYRERDRNGYRAVHLTLVSGAGKAVELQLRTEIQHAWAGLSERRAAVVEHAVKYGGGPEEEQEFLREMSEHGRFIDLRRQETEARNAAFKLRWRILDREERSAMAARMAEDERQVRLEVDRFLESCQLFSNLKG